VDLEIVVNCYNYQHRLCWFLSSLLQQEGNPPNILVNVSYMENNGSPITEEVCSFFREKGLTIKETPLPKKKIFNRSLARKHQSLESKSDWMLFADCDMVYSPFFFDDIAKQVQSDQFKDETKVIGADRVSLKIDFCAKFFDNDRRKYPCVISHVAKRVSKWPIYYIKGKKIAAGYFQLANTQKIKQMAENYPTKRRDRLRVYMADREFRVVMGGRVPMNVKPQYHLNHTRSDFDKQR